MCCIVARRGAARDPEARSRPAAEENPSARTAAAARGCVRRGAEARTGHWRKDWGKRESAEQGPRRGEVTWSSREVRRREGEGDARSLIPFLLLLAVAVAAWTAKDF